MSLTATDKGGADFQIAPEGTYVARCYKMIDMGTQTSTGQFGVKNQHKIMVGWELFDDENKMEDGRPFTLSQFYTVSLNEKAKLRADLEAWRGKKFTVEELKGFDLAKVVGTYCTIQVVHDETGKYANVQAIMKAPKGTHPEPVNDLVVFDIDEPDMAVFEALSDNMKGKIWSAPEWKGAPVEPAKPTKQPTKEEVTIEDMQKEAGTLDDEPINVDDIPF